MKGKVCPTHYSFVDSSVATSELFSAMCMDIQLRWINLIQHALKVRIINN